MSSDRPKLSRQDLRDVAVYQKGILVCILVQVLTFIVQFAIPETFRMFVFPAAVGVVGIVATVFVFLLSLKIYSPGVGVVLGLLTLIPCVGLVTLVVINQKATGLLNRHGYKVGLLGANLSEFNE